MDTPSMLIDFTVQAEIRLLARDSVLSDKLITTLSYQMASAVSRAFASSLCLFFSSRYVLAVATSTRSQQRRSDVKDAEVK